MDDAELVIVNANLWSAGFKRPRRGAISLGGGRIHRVGSNERCESDAEKGAKVVDAGGCMVIPGFIDAHAHMMHTGPRMKWLQLQAIPNLDRLLSLVRREATRRKPGRWLLGRSWDESRWPERRYPTLRELDAVAGGIPVFLRRVDGHMAVVNSAGLRRLEVPRGTEGFDHDVGGRPTGALREKAHDLASDQLRPSVDELVDSFHIMRDIAYRHGITSIHDVVDERGFEAYRRLHRQGVLGLRVNMMPVAKMLRNLRRKSDSSRQDDDWLRLGAIKLFSDGSLGSRTAALFAPYADDKQNGMLVYKAGGLERIARKAHATGYQLATHAIGDRAIDAVIDTYEEILKDMPKKDHRHRIEHFELPSDEALRRCRRLGIVPVMQPNFVVEWSDPGGMYEDRLGRKRARRNNPHALVTRNGLRLAFGSDGMPYGPIYGLQGAVRPPHPLQKIPLVKALEAYTIGGAYASFDESVKGSLFPGMLADLAVINGKWSAKDLSNWKVAATILGGKIVYSTSSFRNA